MKPLTEALVALFVSALAISFFYRALVGEATESAPVPVPLAVWGSAVTVAVATYLRARRNRADV